MTGGGGGGEGGGEEGGDWLAEGLTATHSQPAFLEAIKKAGDDLYEGYRGAPENVGLEFKAVQ